MLDNEMSFERTCLINEIHFCNGYSLLFRPFKKFERNINCETLEFVSNAFGIWNLLNIHHTQSIN